MMRSKSIGIVVSIALICMTFSVGNVVEAQENIEAQLMAEPFANISSALKIPFRFCFYLIFIIGEFPVWIVRGFSLIWRSWGCPPFSAIMSSFTTVVPAVFRDSVITLLFFWLIEAVLLPVVLPLLGLCCVPPAWIITSIGVILFAIADFISKVGEATTPNQRGGGWW